MDLDMDLLQNTRKPVGENGGKMIEKMNEEHFMLTKWGLDQTPIGENVLDVGCGGGRAIEILSKESANCTFTGLDYSEKSVQMAKERNQSLIEAGRVSICQGSVSDLPFGDNSFDTVFSVESYYFWPSLESDMREVYRVVKPGGCFAIIVEMVGGSMDDRYEEIAKRLEMTVLDANEMKELFEKTGYKEIVVKEEKEEGWLYIRGVK